MGKTKIKTINDSIPEKPKNKFSKKVTKSSKVSKSKASEATLGADSRLSEAESSEVARGGAQRGAPKTARSEVVTSEDIFGAAERQDPELAEQKKSQKQGKSKPKSEQSSRIRSKKYQAVVKDLDRSKTYSVDEAVDMVKKLSYSKFNGSLETHIVTAQTGVRGLVSLPFASGRKIRVLAFGKNAPESGADIIGDENIVDTISKGKLNFDLLVTTPEWMPKLAKAAKILGPRGLMPNPKNGTITDDLKKAVTEFHSGKTEYKTEGKTPVIHLSLGKLNQPTEELSTNIKVLLQTLGKSKIVKVNLAPTMGPSVKVDLASV